MTRIKAASNHLMLSVVVFSTIFLILIFLWYPSPYFTASGGWQGLKIAASVDLVLGPLLTLIIFDVKKTNKKLIGDLIVIAMMQFTALGWGINAIYQQRPLAAVFWDDSFYSVPAEALKSQNIVAANLQKYGSQKPVLIYAEKPIEADELKKMLATIKQDGIAPHHQENLYHPLKDYFYEIKSRQVNINEIIETNADMKTDLENILKNTNKNIDDYVYFPLRSKYHNIIFIFNQKGVLINHIVVPLR